MAEERRKHWKKKPVQERQRRIEIKKRMEQISDELPLVVGSLEAHRKLIAEKAELQAELVSM